jgi:hypothetical protein
VADDGLPGANLPDRRGDHVAAIGERVRARVPGLSRIAGFSRVLPGG